MCILCDEDYENYDKSYPENYDDDEGSGDENYNDENYPENNKDDDGSGNDYEYKEDEETPFENQKTDTHRIIEENVHLQYFPYGTVSFNYNAVLLLVSGCFAAH
jgi:hypothetical protein